VNDIGSIRLLEIVDSDAICYSTLRLANLQCFTFVIHLSIINWNIPRKTNFGCWVIYNVGILTLIQRQNVDQRWTDEQNDVGSTLYYVIDYVLKNM